MSLRVVIWVGLVTLTTAARGAAAVKGVEDFWPDHLDLAPLRRHEAAPSPLGADFDYGRAFAALDFAALKADIREVLTHEQSWWPADFGNYGPFFIRMTWHSAGTYRTSDGRGGAEGGQQRFEPLNSWPDNTNLDKARRLLWPVKKKYGRALSWGDLLVLAGNVALESMGVKTFGFGGGRRDDWTPDMVYWGPERAWLGDGRHKGDRQLDRRLAAAQMGLIYVNPEGPNGRPDPKASAKDIREIFGRMAMNDQETVALIAGGHTFGKAHGAHPAKCLGPEPAAAALEQQGLGWENRCARAPGETTTSGLEGAWSGQPTRWTSAYLDNLFTHDWVKTQSPAGATQWAPRGHAADQAVPDARDANRRHPPMMFTTDLALKCDPAYRRIALGFRKDPEAFQRAFARAWFKLTHRDMGPRSRYLGPEVPAEDLLWQDPVPRAEHPRVAPGHVEDLSRRIRGLGVPARDWVRLAWASASTYRDSDHRGGANGARVALLPQRDWAVNDPATTRPLIAKLTALRDAFNRESRAGTRVSLADLSVLAGGLGVEDAARAAGHVVTVPFRPGRTDARQDQTDVASFAVLAPRADGFANWAGEARGADTGLELVERADQLTLAVGEMAALVGGLRGMDANAGRSQLGVMTDRPGSLSPDFFVHLLDSGISWRPAAGEAGTYEGVAREGGAVRWRASAVDLLFGWHAELRAVAEVFAARDGHAAFLETFVRAWSKVMNADRFDLVRP